MKKTFKTYILLLTLFTISFIGCKQKDKEENEAKQGTPVTVCSISNEAMSDYFELNAVSSYLKKNSVRAIIAGTVEQVELNIGDKVEKGQLLYTIRTKEAAALSNRKINADTSFNFNGIIKIVSPKTGIISSVTHQKGDYVQEGDELAVVAEQNSLVFLMQLPFEMKNMVKAGQVCKIILPDNNSLNGSIQSNLPVMDMASQTQNIVVKAESNTTIPENLVATVRILKDYKKQSLALPKECILTNETQNEFWIMKLINDSTAVKIPIRKGIETKEKIEITDPVFTANDKIILTGNYGLEDTARVTIIKK
ncbi:MAG: HlyD family efflux transporter periplasmic adaptor subunit [Bacteroidota bacterium]